MTKSQAIATGDSAGAGSNPRRGPTWGLYAIGLVLAVVVAGAVWIGVILFNSPVRGSLVAFGDAQPDSIEATFDVRRDPASTVVCRLTTVDEYFQTNGELDVVVAPGEPANQRVTTRIPTLGLAKAVTFGGCQPKS